MSFAETRLDLGIDYGTRASLRFNTTVLVAGDGAEQRNANWSQPLGKWQIGDRSLLYPELNYFLDFHAARKGSYEGFRFKDWSDYKAINQQLGIGDGSKKVFQLIKTYTIGSNSVVRPILKPVGNTVRIYLNGVELNSGWSVDITTGVVTFASAPNSNAIITADFEFDVAVRFEQDKIDFRFDAYEVGTGEAIFQLQNLSLIELRLKPTMNISQSSFPVAIAEVLDLGYDYGTVGGPAYNTAIATVGSGYEKRTSNWSESRGKWQIGDRTLTRSELDYLIAIFRLTKGAASEFYYKDWQSNQNKQVRFETDSIEFRFDAVDLINNEAIFYLFGLPVVEARFSAAVTFHSFSTTSGIFGHSACRLPPGRNLNGLRWELPCTSNVSSTVCHCAASTVISTVMDGDMARTYNVTVRFRGVIEYKAYSGGSNNGEHFQNGGIPSNNLYNIYKLEISSPPQIFYLNRGAEGERCYLIDYTKTIQIAGGATVTLTADSIEGAQIKNRDSSAQPIIVPDLAPSPNSYNGQFIQMDVISVN